MAPPSLPRPLHRPSEDFEPGRSPAEEGVLRLPSVPAPQRTEEDAERPRQASHTRELPVHPPDPVGVPRPPGGERLGRLPGLDGPDRLASGVPLPGYAAFDLPALPAAVGAARRVVRHLLTAWGVPDSVRDDAVLVASELVTNALVHAAGERIACRLHGTADRVRIEVADEEGGPALPVARRVGPDDEHGRGLFLVEALSHDWGAALLPDRPARVVWAELRPSRV